MITVICDTPAIIFNGQTYNCRIGRRGYVDEILGREGDEKTPLGCYHARFGLYRADRLPRPRTALTLHPIHESDGWCDDPADPAYNRFVKRPYGASHERLWRADGAYDVVLVISHNDSPPVPDLGSAVFIHIAQPDDRQTLGCVAVTPDVMIRLLGFIRSDMLVIIKAR